MVMVFPKTIAEMVVKGGLAYSVSSHLDTNLKTNNIALPFTVIKLLNPQRPITAIGFQTFTETLRGLHALRSTLSHDTQ